MIQTVSAGDRKGLRLNETDTVSAVVQNIAVILSTPLGSVPMYREFGLDQSFLDLPVPQAEVLMIAPVREAVERWEPRAEVLEVSLQRDRERPERLIPAVKVAIRE